MVKPKEPLYSTYDDLTSDVKSTLLKGSEPVIVDNVTVIGTASKNCMQKVSPGILEVFFLAHPNYNFQFLEKR